MVKSPFFLEQGYSDERCLWGPANYFAVNASYSADGYAHTLPSGKNQMLLCEVRKAP